MANILKQIETRFGTLAYREDGAGSGLPLLLLQRFRGTLDDWDPDFLRRISAGRKVIRMDNAGIGGSEGQVPETLGGMAEVVVSFMDAVGVQRVDLLGWSLGGIVAQHVALSIPDRIRRLVIAGSGPGGVAEGPQPPPRVRETMAHPVNGPEDYLYLFFAESAESRAAGLKYLDRLASVVDRVPAVTGESFMGQLRAIAALRGLRERLGELSMPVFVANGIADVMIPAYRSYVIASEAPNAKLLLYPDSGHAFLFQHAEDFTAEVHRFLDAA
jgi:pimeloyl-ACP methyl ester carboxylesterase